MELKVDFYSKEEVSVRMDISQNNPFDIKEASELFLFTCFTLKQQFNLGDNFGGKMLALLLSDMLIEKAINSMAMDKYTFPSTDELDKLLLYCGIIIYKRTGSVRNDLMPLLPELVNFHGDGKKIFSAVIPPIILDTKGFNIFSTDINYFTFQSVFAVLRYLSKSNKDSANYLHQLSKLSWSCGMAYINKTIKFGDQVSLAHKFLEDLGLHPKIT
jgi:hypothetical protein